MARTPEQWEALRQLNAKAWHAAVEADDREQRNARARALAPQARDGARFESLDGVHIMQDAAEASAATLLVCACRFTDGTIRSMTWTARGEVRNGPFGAHSPIWKSAAVLEDRDGRYLSAVVQCADAKTTQRINWDLDKLADWLRDARYICK
jgi:hypothetical protein